jgi:REP element-mobilizing transposase RayT
MPSTHTSLHYHIVFSTKDRMPFIKCEWKNRLHAYIGGIIKGMDAVPLAVGGLDDHVHVLAGLISSHRLDYFVRDIKADSSVFVHQEFDKKFTWQKGYGAFPLAPRQ